MANHRCGKSRPARVKPAGPPAGVPASVEPQVRRWPHPVSGAEPVIPAQEPALHYIRCALSYQNQLLADIKVLLEQLAAQTAEKPAENKTE